MADTTPVQTSDVSTRLQQILGILFPSNFAAKAALFAVVVALLHLLPSQASKIWELPHLLLLGFIISYGVFGQKNADAEEAAATFKPTDDEPAESYVSQMMEGSLVFDDGDSGNGAKDRVRAWSSQYYPDDPLVVVSSETGDDGDGQSERPLHLPVRRLKPLAQEPATGDVSDGIVEETEFHASKAEYGVLERAIPSPSSVLEADLSLSPCSTPPPPPPPPFLGRGRERRKARARSFNDGGGNPSTRGRLGLQDTGNKFRSNSAKQATRSFADYDCSVSCDQSDVGDDEMDEMVAASDSSFGSDDVVTDGGNGDDDNDNDNYEGNDVDENSCDEELFELATKTAQEEDEVDRKADEFIAKFREQIRLQRFQQART